jgi:transcriptional regulator with XRE-family HTH domain
VDPERSIGAYLARQRELRGISVEELATLTRIPRRSLERLESGVFDRAPDGFVRGFVRTVAAALGLDPDETVMRLLCEPAVESADERRGVAAWASPTVRWAMLAVAGILAATALGWLATSLRARPSVRPDAEVVLRTDPIRELAREAAARARTAEPGPPVGEAAPDPAAMPAEPAALDEIARDAAGEGGELPVVEEPEGPPAAAPPAAPDPGDVQGRSSDANL